MRKYLVIFLTTFIFTLSLFAADNPAPSGELKGDVREIRVEAYRYGFDPDPVVVNLGEKVRFIATSRDVSHGLMIKEFKINETLVKGKTRIIEFTADKVGTFTILCSVYCGPGHEKMTGKLVVRER